MCHYYFFIFIVLATISSNNGYQIPQKQSLAIDGYIQRLKLENWTNEETPCLEKTLTFLENVKNSTVWATWVWNANMLPTGNLFGSPVNLGNFDQCMKPPWLVTHPQFKTQYCIARFSLVDNPEKVAETDPFWSMDEFVNSQTVADVPPNYITWGACVPASCHPHSIVKISRAIYENTNFGTIRPNITVDYCQVAGEKPQYTEGFYWFLALLSSLIVIVVVSTYYTTCTNKDDQNTDSMITTTLRSFCMVNNYQNLMKNNKEDIRVMNGMRFITAILIVSIHEIFYMLCTGAINMRDYDRAVHGLPGYFFLHLDIAVDTFFALSGLLHIKGLLGNADKYQNLFMVLWKRYFRLIGPYAVTILYVTAVSKHTGSGPIWQMTNDIEAEICVKNWRFSLLMLNSNIGSACHIVTWYLSSDYQLTVLATILFYFYRKDRRLGLSAFGTAAVFSLVIPGTLTYWYHLPVVHLVDIRKLSDGTRSYWELDYTYTPSYSRAGAYLVGVAMGYLMTVYKPADYRKIVPKNWSILGTAASLVVMVSMMALGSFYLVREYYPLEAAVATATNRVFWAIAVCCIIGLCEYGTVPLVTNFLGLPIFTPLSRLSYSLYIIHAIIIQRSNFTMRSLMKYDLFKIITNTMGTVVVSLIFSFVMWLLIEAPMINLCNNLFKRQKKTTEQNEIRAQNGDLKAKAL